VIRALAAAAIAVVLTAGCERSAPATAERIAREEFLRRLAVREGRLAEWHLMSRFDVVFEDGFTAPRRIDPRPGARDTGPTGEAAVTAAPAPGTIPARWIGALAHLRVRARRPATDMRLAIWGAVDPQRLRTVPRVTVTFDGVEVHSQLVGDDGRFAIEEIIPRARLGGWSDVYLSLSSVHEPRRDPQNLQAARVEGVAWEPAR